jgi:hypothetical protein
MGIGGVGSAAGIEKNLLQFFANQTKPKQIILFFKISTVEHTQTNLNKFGETGK